MNIPRVIGLTGRARAGKSTAAEILHREWGYVREKFSTSLKDMLRAIGVSEEMIEGNQKDLPVPWFCNHTTRYAMQTLGTEWGRGCIGQDFWVRLLETRILLKPHRLFVVEDVRFENEAAMIRNLGGIVIRITRLEASLAEDNHLSEQEMTGIVASYTLTNDNTKDALSWLLKGCLEHYVTTSGR